MAPPLLPVHFQKQESPPSRSRAGQEGGVRCYLLIRYVRSPPSGLKDSTWYPAFFIAPARKPRTVCFCQPIFFITSASMAPPFRCSMATTWAVLLPSRGAAASFALTTFLPLGALLGRSSSWPPCPWRARPWRPVRHGWPPVRRLWPSVPPSAWRVGAPSARAGRRGGRASGPPAPPAPRGAACAPPLAFRSAFGLAGWCAFGSGVPTGAAAFGATGSPSPWMRAQIRLMAVFRSLNFLTAVTPGRLFHTARSLSAGQWAARSANSCWLAKESNGVAVAAAASSWVANTLMLFSLSMVNVFIWVLSWHGVAVTLTFIHSGAPHRQGKSDWNREWRRGGDDAADLGVACLADLWCDHQNYRHRYGQPRSLQEASRPPNG